MDEKELREKMELDAENMDKVAGGMIPVNVFDWVGHGNESDNKVCWQCGDPYEYVAGMNMHNPNDPRSHFCSDACYQKFKKSMLR